MTKENIFKTFLEDPILVEQKYVSPENIDTLKWSDSQPSKILDVLKLVINGNVDGENDAVTIRKISQLLNK